MRVHRLQLLLEFGRAPSGVLVEPAIADFP